VIDKKITFMKLRRPENRLFLSEYQTTANKYHYLETLFRESTTAGETTSTVD
jgi:hypothetical protein